MVLIILETVPTSVRGELSRWMLEPKPGVFIGHVNALVRNKLWEKCCRHSKVDHALQVWSTNNEQRFQVRQFGVKNRAIVEMEGIQLVQRPISKNRRQEIAARLTQTR